MDINTRLYVHTHPFTTATGDRDPGRNLYFGSPRKRNPPQPKSEQQGPESGVEESEHHIDIIA
ncbi:MAG: hypothetical protein O2999_01915 [Nitrospirae bacterium]|nr:hypothetical protein [Nitrospirota bacterium]MDA1303057.1 hypothetical protein [Nitrospirota bacterium]